MCKRCELSGTAHFPAYTFKTGYYLFGIKFICNSPTRIFFRKAQHASGCKILDFYNRSVNLEIQFIAPLRNAFKLAYKRINTAECFAVRVDGKVLPS